MWKKDKFCKEVQNKKYERQKITAEVFTGEISYDR